jgi:HAD superfamily hydrolase (TIGR01484 family)
MPGRLSEWLLAIDLDGTLLRHDGQVAVQDRRALCEALQHDAAIILVTARFPRAAQRIVQQLGLTLPRACLDGALVFDGQARCLRRALLPIETVRAVCTLAARYGARCLSMHEQHVLHREQDASHLGYVRGWFEDHPVVKARVLDSTPSLWLLALGARDDVTRICAEVPAHDHVVGDVFELGTSGVWAARFRHTLANKGAAALFWGQCAQRERRLLAIGNDYNDLPLFSIAQRAYAMADAPHAVIAAATHHLQSDGTQGGGIAEVIGALL